MNCRIADNDMNTWEAINAGNALLLKNAKYVIWRNAFKLAEPYQKAGGIVLFKKVAGKAEVWLNRKLLGKKNTVNERDFKVEFPPMQEDCELRVLLHSSANTHVGLKGMVTIQSK